MIGQEIIEHLRFRGSVKRVMFSAEDEISIKNRQNGGQFLTIACMKLRSPGQTQTRSTT